MLSRHGYKALGVCEKEWPRDAYGTPSFAQGMAADEDTLAPVTGIASWEAPFEERIDGAIMIAEDTKSERDAEVSRLVNQPAWLSSIEWKHVEHGDALHNALGQRIEHFGFADGGSQPLFYKFEIDQARQRSHDPDAWDDALMGAELVLRRVEYSVPRPDGSTAESHGFGSFVVVRKLEQDVQGFLDFTEVKMKEALGDAYRNPDHAGALLVGRFPDGTPLAFSETPHAERIPRNDFNYKNDGGGAKCPFHAHIRRANQRETHPSPRAIAEHQFVRRGITYGQRRRTSEGHLDPTDRPRCGVGLLFIGYMASIVNQFRTVQHWLNHRTLIGTMSNDTVDPIAGQSAPAPEPLPCPVNWGDRDGERRPVSFGTFVTPRGGEYFFAPPVGFLRHGLW